MCKLFAITDMSRVKVTEKFIRAVKNEVCKTSDKDGFGYTILNTNSTMGGERTLEPETFKPFDTLNDKVISKLPIIKVTSNNYGKLNTQTPKSFMAHGRFSTNSVSLANTHPFVNKSVALMHNGVVQDSKLRVKHLLKTNCDTEILLRYWETTGFKGIEENVTGYYAIMVMDSKGKLHVIRDDRATLYITYVRDIGSFMIATTIDIIKGVCKSMKWKCEQPEMIENNTYAIFDGNDIESHSVFSPLGSASYGMTGTEQQALGLNSNYGYEGKYSGRWQESDPYEDDSPAYKDLAAVDDYMLKNNLKTIPDNVDDIEDNVLSMSAKDLMKKYGNYKR